MKRYTVRHPQTGEELSITESSGNVFADLGLPNPEENLTKVRLYVTLLNIFDSLKLSQKEIAKRLGTDQPKISALRRAKLDGFSVQRLMEFIAALGYEVDIVIRKRGSRKSAKIPVRAA